MTIAVKWKGKLVGEIEEGRLTSATKTFQGLWDEFQLNGVRLTGFPDPASEDGKEGDNTYVSRATGVFLNQLQSAGFSIKGD